MYPGTSTWHTRTTPPPQVVVEFHKSNDRGRVIKLKHSPAVLPPQLYGRVAPEVWAAFMNDCQALALRHPYVVRPGAGRVAGWAGGLLLGAVVGFCCLNPDGGCGCAQEGGRAPAAARGPAEARCWRAGAGGTALRSQLRARRLLLAPWRGP
jgi:hypothetical protein